VTDPQFTVILATWNRASLLPRALESLSAQSFTDWEAVIVDDGGTDDTPRVAAPFLADPRFRLLLRPHAGLSAARNAGAAIARGAALTFLDSDDAYAPGHLAERDRLARAHPEAVLIHDGYTVIGPPEAHFVPDARDPARMIPLADCVVGGTFVIPARVFREVGGFPDIPYAMDFALFNALEARGPVIRCAAPTYLYHRETGEGMCAEARDGGTPRGTR